MLMLKKMIDYLPYAMLMIDNKGTVVSSNKKVKHLFGVYDVFNIEKRKIVDIFNEIGIVNEVGNKSINVCIKYLSDIRNKNKNFKFNSHSFIGQEKLYYSIEATSIWEGECLRNIIVVLTNITEKIENEHKLKREREEYLSLSAELKCKCEIIEKVRLKESNSLTQFKDIVNNSVHGFILLNKDKNIESFNSKALKILECNEQELILYSDILKDKTNIQKTDQYVILDEKVEEGDSLRRLFVFKINNKNKYIKSNFAVIRDEDKNIKCYFISFKDITDSKEYELKLKKQKNFIVDVLNEVEGPIAVIGYPNMNLQFANKSFQKIFNINSDKIDKELNTTYSLNILKKFYEDNRDILSKSLLKCGVNKECIEHTPYQIIDDNGKIHYYRMKFKPCTSIDGENDFSIQMQGTEITEEIIRAQESEKLTRVKDDFFNMMSHELRTPLNIIYSSLQLAKDIYSREITPNIEKTFYRINQNCGRLLKLINNILYVSKAEAGFLEINNTVFNIVSLTEEMMDMINLYAQNKKIELIFDTNVEEYLVTLDKEKYEKIFMNLLSNALKYTQEGKTVLVTLECFKEYISLMVHDQGVGIPQNKLEKIFDRYVQVDNTLSRKAEGTGLGLSLVKNLVDILEGEIYVDSEEGIGTTFNIRLNLKENNQINENNSMIITNINDKIDVEFSDVY